MSKIDLEQLIKIHESWDKYGSCNSCGWHSAFYEVEDMILPHIFDESNWESDGSFMVVCSNDEDASEHRGCYLYDFK